MPLTHVLDNYAIAQQRSSAYHKFLTALSRSELEQAGCASSHSFGQGRSPQA